MEMLSQKELNELLNYDPNTGMLFWKNRPEHLFTSERLHKSWNTQYAGKEAFTSDNGRGYKQGAIFGKLYKAHRVIFCMVYGYWPDQIDHINQNRSDNSLKNLREVSNNENQKNKKKRKNNTSGVTGVSWNTLTKKWYARISVKGVKITLGKFDSISEAKACRAEGEKLYNYHPNHGKG